MNEHIAPAGLVDLSMAAIDVIDALAPQARDKGVTFDPVLPPRGGAVPGEERCLVAVEEVADRRDVVLRV